MSTPIITEFLESRLVEDEGRANKALAWIATSPNAKISWYGAPGDKVIKSFGDAGELIATWSPARVLAECAAKRGIVERSAVIHDTEEGEWGVGYTVSVHGWQEGNTGTELVQVLAAVYKDHPDYRQEWAL